MHRWMLAAARRIERPAFSRPGGARTTDRWDLARFLEASPHATAPTGRRNLCWRDQSQIGKSRSGWDSHAATEKTTFGW